MRRAKPSEPLLSSEVLKGLTPANIKQAYFDLQNERKEKYHVSPDFLKTGLVNQPLYTVITSIIKDLTENAKNPKTTTKPLEPYSIRGYLGYISPQVDTSPKEFAMCYVNGKIYHLTMLSCSKANSATLYFTHITSVSLNNDIVKAEVALIIDPTLYDYDGFLEEIKGRVVENDDLSMLEMRRLMSYQPFLMYDTATNLWNATGILSTSSNESEPIPTAFVHAWNGGVNPKMEKNRVNSLFLKLIVTFKIGDDGKIQSIGDWNTYIAPLWMMWYFNLNVPDWIPVAVNNAYKGYTFFQSPKEGEEVASFDTLNWGKGTEVLNPHSATLRNVSTKMVRSSNLDIYASRVVSPAPQIVFFEDLRLCNSALWFGDLVSLLGRHFPNRDIFETQYIGEIAKNKDGSLIPNAMFIETNMVFKIFFTMHAVFRIVREGADNNWLTAGEHLGEIKNPVIVIVNTAVYAEKKKSFVEREKISELNLSDYTQKEFIEKTHVLLDRAASEISIPERRAPLVMSGPPATPPATSPAAQTTSADVGAGASPAASTTPPSAPATSAPATSTSATTTSATTTPATPASTTPAPTTAAPTTTTPAAPLPTPAAAPTTTPPAQQAADVQARPMFRFNASPAAELTPSSSSTYGLYGDILHLSSPSPLQFGSQSTTKPSFLYPTASGTQSTTAPPLSLQYTSLSPSGASTGGVSPTIVSPPASGFGRLPPGSQSSLTPPPLYPYGPRAIVDPNTELLLEGEFASFRSLNELMEAYTELEKEKRKVQAQLKSTEMQLLALHHNRERERTQVERAERELTDRMRENRELQKKLEDLKNHNAQLTSSLDSAKLEVMEARSKIGGPDSFSAKLRQAIDKLETIRESLAAHSLVSVGLGTGGADERPVSSDPGTSGTSGDRTGDILLLAQETISQTIDILSETLSRSGEITEAILRVNGAIGDTSSQNVMGLLRELEAKMEAAGIGRNTWDKDRSYIPTIDDVGHALDQSSERLSNEITGKLERIIEYLAGIRAGGGAISSLFGYHIQPTQAHIVQSRLRRTTQIDDIYRLLSTEHNPERGLRKGYEASDYLSLALHFYDDARNDYGVLRFKNAPIKYVTDTGISTSGKMDFVTIDTRSMGVGTGIKWSDKSVPSDYAMVPLAKKGFIMIESTEGGPVEVELDFGNLTTVYRGMEVVAHITDVPHGNNTLKVILGTAYDGVCFDLKWVFIDIAEKVAPVPHKVHAHKPKKKHTFGDIGGTAYTPKEKKNLNEDKIGENEIDLQGMMGGHSSTGDTSASSKHEDFDVDEEIKKLGINFDESAKTPSRSPSPLYEGFGSGLEDMVLATPGVGSILHTDSIDPSSIFQRGYTEQEDPTINDRIKEYRDAFSEANTIIRETPPMSIGAIEEKTGVLERLEARLRQFKDVLEQLENVPRATTTQKSEIHDLIVRAAGLIVDIREKIALNANLIQEIIGDESLDEDEDL